MDKFKKGDKVWIQRVEFVDNVEMIRNVQTISEVMEIPGLDSQAIYIKGSRYLFTEKDLKHENRHS